MLWAVANTLTVFAIRDVGLAIAFPLWNTNSLVGILWGRLLFGELKGASRTNVAKVVLGRSGHRRRGHHARLQHHSRERRARRPRRRRSSRRDRRQPAVGNHVHSLSQGLHQRHESALVRHRLHRSANSARCSHSCFALDGGTKAAVFHSSEIRHLLFWLFLGGFVWVIGDLFQQFATKYLGIGRGIPLSNTNQMWGLAWGALVFGELAHADAAHRLLVVIGSLVMILRRSRRHHRRRHREGKRIDARVAGPRVCPLRPRLRSRHPKPMPEKQSATTAESRAWWDYVILACAVGVFVWLGVNARVPALPMNFAWVGILVVILLTSAFAGAWMLWKKTNFS